MGDSDAAHDDEGSAVSRATARPTGEVRTFGHDEIIVSKTDPQGRITYVNETFVRVSAYAEHELLGQPHSIVRHPESPRGLFHLMWDRIGHGHEVFAYIDNLAADGASYWVLAHVTPSRDAAGRIVGYHSNRRSPQVAAVRQIEDLYRRMRAAERGITNAREAAVASRAVLEDELAWRGLTYDEFVWDVIVRNDKAVAA